MAKPAEASAPKGATGAAPTWVDSVIDYGRANPVRKPRSRNRSRTSTALSATTDAAASLISRNETNPLDTAVASEEPTQVSSPPSETIRRPWYEAYRSVIGELNFLILRADDIGDTSDVLRAAPYFTTDKITQRAARLRAEHMDLAGSAPDTIPALIPTTNPAEAIARSAADSSHREKPGSQNILLTNIDNAARRVFSDVSHYWPSITELIKDSGGYEVEELEEIVRLANGKRNKFILASAEHYITVLQTACDTITDQRRKQRVTEYILSMETQLVDFTSKIDRPLVQRRTIHRNTTSTGEGITRGASIQRTNGQPTSFRGQLKVVDIDEPSAIRYK